MRNKLMILAVIAIAAFQTSCVKPGHNYVSDGLPLDGTVWKAQFLDGAYREVSTLYFYADGKMFRRFETFDNEVPRIIDEQNGTYQYESPEGTYTTLDNRSFKFLVNGKQLTIPPYAPIYYCIQGRD